MNDRDDVDPSETAGRLISEEPRHFAEAPTLIHDSVAHYRLLWALLAGFAIIFATDVYGSSKYWRDLHDVTDTIAPFVTLFAGAIGSAITFYFTDRNRR